MSETRVQCPECEKTCASLSGLKGHMARMHGGYTDEQIAAVAAVAPPPEPTPVIEGEFVPEPPPIPPPPTPEPVAAEPKRYTKHSRELNDQLNAALQLCLKHLTKGMTDEERQQLDFYRSAVTSALIGVEFDFDERLFVLRSKIWLLVSVAILYGIEKLPSLNAMLAFIRNQQRKDKKESADGDTSAKPA